MIRRVARASGDPHYALAKLDQAIYELAIGPGDIRQRLHDAFIVFAPVSPNDFPSALRPKFAGIRTSLTKKEPWGEEGRLNATLRGMKRATGVQIAKRIVALEAQLRPYCEDDE